MATTKSTVVGIRLDHERRAWVEAEAARRGLSVRGLFEGMIDEARSGEMVGDARPTVAAASSPPAAVGASKDEVAAMSGPEEPAASGAPDGVHAAPAQGAPVTSSLRSGIGSVADVPVSLVREALSLTASLIDLSGRCATNRLGQCVLTRHWVKRSV
jgi:hypothetical protein